MTDQGVTRRAVLLASLTAPLAARHAAAELLPKADLVIVFKARRELLLLRKGELVKAYPIALGWQPKGPKRRKGDGRTPEGIYRVDGRNPRSRYRLSLHLSYPNAADTARARAAGIDPGDGIFIHGMPRYFGRADPVRFFVDWTDGCIAVGNVAIEEIWDAVDDGTPVEIRP